jgi:hypothetical protein
MPADQDQAAPADAIGVFGAAEYDGRPSPVYRARLDHARDLFHRGIAPLIITLGGNGGDEYTEGRRGPRVPDGHGRPRERHHRRDREPQHRGVGPPHCRHCPRQRLRRLVIVSDGTHLFRIHEICAAEGSTC